MQLKKKNDNIGGIPCQATHMKYLSNIELLEYCNLVLYFSNY